MAHPVIQDVSMLCIDVHFVGVCQSHIQNLNSFPQVIYVLESIIGFCLATLELAVHDAEAILILHALVV